LTVGRVVFCECRIWEWFCGYARQEIGDRKKYDTDLEIHHEYMQNTRRECDESKSNMTATNFISGKRFPYNPRTRMVQFDKVSIKLNWRCS